MVPSQRERPRVARVVPSCQPLPAWGSGQTGQFGHDCRDSLSYQLRNDFAGVGVVRPAHRPTSATARTPPRRHPGVPVGARRSPQVAVLPQDVEYTDI